MPLIVVTTPSESIDVGPFKWDIYIYIYITRHAVTQTRLEGTDADPEENIPIQHLTSEGGMTRLDVGLFLSFHG